MQIHGYLVHFDEDIVGEDSIHGRVVLRHGYDLFVQVCDDCVTKLDTEYKGHSWRDDGVMKSWACCYFCRVVVREIDESEPESPRESKQLEFDWGSKE